VTSREQLAAAERQPVAKYALSHKTIAKNVLPLVVCVPVMSTAGSKDTAAIHP